MLNNTTAFDGLKSQVRPYLKDFLIENSIDISDNGMLKCINPMHSDNSPSMKILSDLNNEQLYCYTCGCKADIFAANHILNDVPIEGLGFIKENVYELANRYHIPYEEVEFTSEQLEIMAQIRFNKLVCDTMQAIDDRGRPVNWTVEHAIERGWKEGTCKVLKIATVLDYNKFLRALSISSGYSPEEIRDSKDVTADKFGPNHITIPIFDERGQPIGYTARNLKWKKDKSKGHKYVNSHNSVTFHKSKVLYGIHLCRNSKGRRLDLFEGNGSFITAFGAGHKSCAALSGDNLSDHQIDLALKMGFKHINLCLDGDAAGRKKTKQIMVTLSGREGLKVTCSWLPDTMDPDQLIIESGLEALYKLGTVSSFRFFLEEDAEAAKKGDISRFVSKMIRIIQNTENRIERGQQLSELAIVLDIPEEDIRSEMTRIEQLNVDSIKMDINKGIYGAKDTDEILSTMEKIRNTIESTTGSANDRVNLSYEESLENFLNLTEILRNKKEGIQGWKTGFGLLDLKLSGIPKPMGKDDNGDDIPIPGSLIGIAGPPQHAKSCILQGLAVNMAMLNDDICVLFWALDDSRERALERIICMVSGIEWKVVTRRVPPTPKETIKINEACKRIEALIREGRLVLKDQSNGSTIPMLKRWIESTKKQFDRPICVIIDSFHKIGTSSDEKGTGDFSKTKKHSEDIKTLYKTHHVTIMASLELNKGATRGIEPDTMHITESRKMEYDFDVLATVFNHFYDMDGQSDCVIYDQGCMQPLIKFNIRKSKEGGMGPMYFALNTNNFRITAYSMAQIKSLTNTDIVTEIKSETATIVPPDKGNLKPQYQKEPWS